MAPRTQPTEPGPGKSGLPPTGVPVPRPAADTATAPPTEHKLSSLHATKLPRNALRPAPLFGEKSGREPSPPKTPNAATLTPAPATLTPAPATLAAKPAGTARPVGPRRQLPLSETPAPPSAPHPWAVTPDPPAGRASAQAPPGAAAAPTPKPWDAPSSGPPPAPQPAPAAPARPSTDTPTEAPTDRVPVRRPGGHAAPRRQHWVEPPVDGGPLQTQRTRAVFSPPPPPWAAHESRAPAETVRPSPAAAEPGTDTNTAAPRAPEPLPEPVSAPLSQSVSEKDEGDWNLREIAKRREQDLANVAAVDEQPSRLGGAVTRQWAACQDGLRRALGLDRWRPHLDRLRRNLKFVRPLVKIAAPLLLLFTPLGDSFRQIAGGGLASLHEQMSRRAAFQVVEEFPDQEGPEWLQAAALNPASFGAGSLSLHRSTMDFVDYHLDFVCRLEDGSISWVVRATDHDTYLAFRLSRSGRTGKPKYVLTRFPVVTGQVDESERIEVDVTQIINPASNRVSIRLRGETVGTFIEGRGVDFWKDNLFHKGGVGLWFKAGDPQRVQRLAVYGNEDFWGLTLYAALQTADRLRAAFDSPLADPDADQRASLETPLEAAAD